MYNSRALGKNLYTLPEQELQLISPLLQSRLPLQKGQEGGGRLCQETPPNSCQEPLPPLSPGAHDGSGKGAGEVMKVLPEPNFASTAAAVSPPHLGRS